MGSKAILFLCLSLAVVLMVASEVAARELAETNSKEDENAKGLGEANYPGGRYPGGGYSGAGFGGGGHCRYGCCGRGYRGCRCCSHAGEAVDAEPQTQPHN